jgi:CBS domain-containing protein
VVYGDEFEGVVTRRQLATSHHPPDEKLSSLVWHVPRLAPDEDVRDVARLMIDADSHLLPVFEGRTLRGVVTAGEVLRAVEPYLDAATVGQACTRDLVTVAPDSTFGDALHRFREHHITHLPVVDDDEAIGILSLYDVMGITTRRATQPTGGEAAGTDSFGGDLASGRSRGGGFGAREGERTRILDLPVRDVMTEPVRTVAPEATLAAAVDEMFAVGGSSLVVTDNGSPFGIVTKTDVLDALTWEAEGNRAVQIYGTDLLGDVSYDEVVAMVESFDDRDAGMTLIDAKIHLHEHDEMLRGTPLVLARVRLHTDRGLYVASGEGYGAKFALNEARDTIERQIRDRKTYGRSKKHPDEAYWEKRFGWILEE